MSRLTGSEAQGLMEAYNAVYAPQELTEEQIWEEVESWVNSLLEEGYDLSEYTWEEMYEEYINEQGRGASVGSNPNVSQNPIAKAIRGEGQNSARTAGQINQARMRPGTSPSRPQNRLGSLPPSARQVPQYPAGVPTGVGGGNAGASVQPPAKPATPPRPGTPATPPRPGTPAAAKPAPTAPAAPGGTPAPTAGSQQQKPLVGGIERRTPTSAELKAAQALRAPVPTTGPLGAAVAAAGSKPVAFDPSSSTSTPTPAAATTPPAAKKPVDIRNRNSMARGGFDPRFDKQSFDLFDVIKGHLLDEGYADNEDAALAIMANMSEEWKQSIVEAQEARNNPEEYERKEAKKKSKKQRAMEDPHTGINSPAFEKFMRQQMGR